MRQYLTGHETKLTAIAASPGTSLFASADTGGVIKLWNVDTCVNAVTTKVTSPYSGMNIADATGLSKGQTRALRELGAVASRRPSGTS